MTSFYRCERGNFAIMGAIMLPVLVGAAGLAVDYAALLNARSELQQATDAAVLAAAKDVRTNAQRRQAFETFLHNSRGKSLAVKKAELDVNEGLNFIEITGTATADVNLFFLHRVGARPVSAKATAFQSTQSLAISLVLDNTGSMGQAGINALKKASRALVDAVESNSNGRQDVHVSLVPFVTAVNIKGEGFDSRWIDQDGKSLYNGWNFLNEELRQRRRNGERLTHLPDDYADEINGKPQACKNQGNGDPAIEKRERCDALEAAKAYPHQMKLFELSGTTWKGCVEARPGPYNLDLAAPTEQNPDTLFVPYFAPDEPGSATWGGGNDGNSYNNSWLDDIVSDSDDLVQRSTLKYVDPEVKLVEEAKALTRGPNRACPTPITPLTKDLSKIRTAIDAMQFWNGSGTNISEGLAWGWRVLSPGEPYAQAGALGTSDVKKYLVLMTDGRNVSFGAKKEGNRSDYGSYGFLNSGRIGGTNDQGKAETALNEWTLKLCSDVKKQGIEIFTVVYNEKAASVHNMFKACASKPTNFHLADNTRALEAAFAKIGSEMSVLHLTQ